MRKRTAVRVISFLSAGLLAAGIFALTGMKRTKALELYARTGVQRTFDELVTSVSELSTALEKSVYVTDPGLESALCTQIFSRAAAAQMMMGALPYSSRELERTSTFLSAVGDYACTLARTVGDGGGYSEEELDNLTALSDTADVMAMDLRDMQARILDGRLTMDEVWSAADAADLGQEGQAPLAGTAFQSMEQEFPELPTLIYDGPFSESVQKAEPVYLRGMDQVSRDRARQAAAKLLGVSADTLADNGETAGKLPCYCFGARLGGGEYSVMVTKQGGLVLSVLCSRLPGPEKLTAERGCALAAAFLRDQGYENMKETYHMAEGGIVTVNFAYAPEGVICYPDLVKVGVALDTGAVVSWDAKGYLSAHHDRDLPEPELTAAEAAAQVSPRLAVRSLDLAVIPTPGGEERLCHELRCEAEDGRCFLLYVNALTGRQERILILLQDEGGTLTI